MSKVTLTTRLPKPVAEIWSLIGGFNALPDWHPAIERSTLEEGGTQRRLSLAGGGEIIERLEKMDDEGHRYRYRILSGPLPVQDYVAEIRVRPDPSGDGCEVEWSSEFKAVGASPDDAQAVIRGIYEAGFDNLRRVFGGR